MGRRPRAGGTGRVPVGAVPPSYLQSGQIVEGRVGDLLACSFRVVAPAENAPDRVRCASAVLTASRKAP